MKLKGVSPLIAFALVIMITLTAVGIVLTFGLNIINRARDQGVISEATENTAVLDNLIQQVASGGAGSLNSGQIHVSDGAYRVDPDSNELEFSYVLKSDVLQPGAAKKSGAIYTQVLGSVASATQNSTHLILQNEILQVVLPKIGNKTSFTGINTSNILSTVTLRNISVTVMPNDTSIIVGNVTNTTWGLGYSEIVREGDFLTRAEALVHVKSNLTGTEYDVLYSLPASSDFLIVTVTNVSTNQTTMNLAYRLGSVGTNDVIRIDDVNETTYQSSPLSPPRACYTAINLTTFYECSYDSSEFTTSVSLSLIYASDKNNFNQFCFDSYGSNDHKFNVTSTSGNLKAVLPFTETVCTTIGNQTSVVQSQKLPSGPFTSYSLQGTPTFSILLKYEKIKLAGNFRAGSGTYRFCAQKVGQDGTSAVINVTKC